MGLTAMRDEAQYHCCFLLEKASATLNMAIAWRRVGNHDYGVYLTKRQGAEDLTPQCTLFKASYSNKGEILGFLVKDGWIELGKRWDDDHLEPGMRSAEVMPEDVEHLELLAKAFFAQWLESFGESDALVMLKRLGLSGGHTTHAWRRILTSGLPAEIQKAKLPDVLSCAKSTERGFLYSFVPFPESPGTEKSTASLLEAKMRMFFELL